jgi:hypothetical protein
VLVSHAADHGLRVPYGEAIAMNEILMDTLEAAHVAAGGPYCLGTMAWSNVLLDRQGGVRLFGFGHNFPTRPTDGQVGAPPGTCQAPEVLLGVPATCASDVFCLHAMLRQLLPYTELLPPLAAAVQGAADLVQLRDALSALATAASIADPAARLPTVAALRSAYRGIRAIAPPMPDPDFIGLARRLAALVEEIDGASGRPRLRLDRRSRSVTLPDGRAVELQRHRTLWAILEVLVEAHREAPGQAVGIDSLIARGWPREKVLPDAGRARVYVAISSLRKLGLGAFIVKRDDGYLLSPTVSIA